MREETAVIATQYNTERFTGTAKEIQMVETDFIHPNPYRESASYTTKETRLLAEQMKKEGTGAPLLIENEGTRENPFYLLLCGEAHFRAALFAGLEKMPCIITENGTAADTGTHNIPLPRNCFEEAEVLQSILEGGKYDKPKLSKKLGLSLGGLENKLLLCQLSEAEKDILLKKEVSPRHCILYARLKSEVRKEIAGQMRRPSFTAKEIQERIEKEANGGMRDRLKIVISDTRPFFNSVFRAVETMRKAGFAITTQENDRPDCTELVIRVPKEKQG